MPVMLEMMRVVRVTGDVHPTGIPIPRARDGLRSPVRPDAELGIAEPIRCLVGLQRVCCRLKRTAGDGKLIGGRRGGHLTALVWTALLSLRPGVDTERGQERCS